MTTLEPNIGTTTTRGKKRSAGARRQNRAWRTSPGRVLRQIFLWGDLAAVTIAAVMSDAGRIWGTATAVVLILSNAAARLYRRRLSLSWGRDTPRGLAAAAAALGVLVGAAIVLGRPMDTIVTLARCVGLAVLLLGSFRVVFLLLARWARRAGFRERVLVAGAGPVGVSLVQAMREHPQYGLEPVGFVDRTPGAGIDLPAPVVGSDVAESVIETGVTAVVLAFSAQVRDAQIVDAAIKAQQAGAALYAVPRMFEMYHDGLDVERLRSYPLVRITALPRTLKLLFRLAPRQLNDEIVKQHLTV